MKNQITVLKVLIAAAAIVFMSSCTSTQQAYRGGSNGMTQRNGHIGIGCSKLTRSERNKRNKVNHNRQYGGSSFNASKRRR
jgi:hypothetical protein